MKAEGVLSYGNWRIPKSAGFGKLSLPASLGVVAALVFAVVLNLFTNLLWAGGFLLVAGLLVWAGASKDRFGVSLMMKGEENMRFWRAKRRRTNIYRSGPLSVDPAKGRCELPGILGSTSLTSHVDSYEREFALIHHQDGTVAVVFSVAPPGVGLVDQDTIDTSVARWGMWVASLSGESGVAGATVTVESVPDSGARLRREVEGRMTVDAPSIAKEVLRSVIVEYRVGAAMIRGWVSVTFDPAKMGMKQSNGQNGRVAADIASRLPGITGGLEGGTGAGAVHLMTAADLARVVRVAFDPASETIFEDAAERGEQVNVTWADAGPLSHEAGRDHYFHDSGSSRVWVMTTPPTGLVQAGVLGRLLAPHRDIERKRITILYKPVGLEMAPKLVERDVSQAAARVQTAQRASFRALRELEAAKQVAAEEANGSSLVDFGMIITATSTSDDVEEMSSAVGALASSCRLMIRPAYGVQDSAFALGLPLGLRPASSQTIGGGSW